MSKLSEVYRLKGDKERLVEAYEDLAQLRERIFGETHRETGFAYFMAGNEYYLRREMEKAEYYFTKGLKVEDPEDITMVVIMKASLGNISALKEKTEEAEQLLVEALALGKGELGASHMITERCIDDLANFYFGQKDYEKCCELNEELLEIQRETHGSADVSTLTTLVHLAVVYDNLGKGGKVRYALNEVIRGHRELEGKLDESTYNIFMHLFHKYDNEQKKGEKRNKIYKKDVKKVESLMEIGGSYQAKGDDDKAIKAYSQAAELIYNMFESGGPANFDSIVMSGFKLFELGRFDVAEVCMKRALAMLYIHDQLNTEMEVIVLKLMDCIYTDNHEKEKELENLEKLLAVNEIVYGLNSDESYKAMLRLYETYLAIKDFAKAEGMLRKIIAMLEETVNPDHEAIVEFKKRLDEIVGL